MGQGRRRRGGPDLPGPGGLQVLLGQRRAPGHESGPVLGHASAAQRRHEQRVRPEAPAHAMGRGKGPLVAGAALAEEPELLVLGTSFTAQVTQTCAQAQVALTDQFADFATSDPVKSRERAC